MTTRRRPRGSGTVRNRGTERSPKWFASYSLSVDGKRRQISKGPFPLKVDAETWLRDELRRKSEGRATVPKRITVGELCDEWLTGARRRLAPNTFVAYSAVIEQRIKPHVGHVRLDQLRPGHVVDLLDALRAPGSDLRSRTIDMHGNRTRPGDHGLSETSISHTYVLLSTICKWAVKQRYIPYNPCADVDRPTREESEMTCWDADQLHQFLAVDDRMMPLFRLLSMTGMRRSEALALQWRDIDLDAATVSVHAARIVVGNEMVTRSKTKTKRGTRSVDLDPTTVAVLRRWRLAQRQERWQWREAYTDSGYVFTREDGNPVGTMHVTTRFRRLVKAAGVPTIRLHDLRHTHATLMLSSGVPVHIAAARLGHAADIMLSTYAHVLPQAQAEAAASVASLVDGHG